MGEISDMNDTPAFQKRTHHLPRLSCWCSDCMNMRVGDHAFATPVWMLNIPCCLKQ